jgi:hypothetical protein
VVDGCAPNKAIAERKSESGDSGGIVQYIALTRPRAVFRYRQIILYSDSYVKIKYTH